MVGTYQGREITATSTGMGCPSTAIAVEELARVGVTSFIRVGSTGALQPGISPGDLIVSEGSFRNDGTSAAYVPAGYPAVPDLEITMRLHQEATNEAEGQSFAAHSGLNVTDDAFYAESPEWTRQMTELGMLNVEMESAALYVVARQRGLRAGMICSVSSNLVEGTSVYDDQAHDRLATGWHHSIEVALRTAVALSL
jgi:uridine phosphorylase